MEEEPGYTWGVELFEYECYAEHKVCNPTLKPDLCLQKPTGFLDGDTIYMTVKT